MNARTYAMTSAFITGFSKAILPKIAFFLALLIAPMATVTGPELGQGSLAFAGDGGPPDNPGGGGGGGGSGGKPDNPGGGDGKPDKPGRGKGDLYADLVFVYRTVDGLPIFIGVPEGIGEEEETVTAVRARGTPAASALPDGYVACEQPVVDPPVVDQAGMISAYVLSTVPHLSNPLENPADGRDVVPIPLGGSGVAGEECDVMFEGGAEPDYDFRGYPDEVQFGRINVGRSPERVLTQQMREVVKLMTGADVEIGWDLAARLTVNGVAIDSPLQSLAIHEMLMEHGHITGTPPLPDLPWNDVEAIEPLDLDWLDYAAAALGGAADKGSYSEAGGLNLDLIVYNNRILHIPAETVWADRIEGNGTDGVLNEWYVDYSTYHYDRYAKYPGCWTGMSLLYPKEKGFIIEDVFGFVDNDFSGDNIYGFATAADDSRRVISFSHDFLDGARFDGAGEVELCCELELLVGEDCL